MNIRMGGKIRQLRKERGVSQEVLAQYLGVTFQAVSKWENGTAMPDVAAIPAIASFFGVSTDELFDFNRMEQEKRIMEIVGEAAAYRGSNPAEGERILREALRKYPGNDVLLNNLLYVLQAPEHREEVVTICRSLIEGTREDDVKYDACRILAETYREMGENEMCRQTLEMIPEIYFSKLELVANLLDGEDALRAARSQAYLSRDDLMDMLSRLAQLYRERGEMDKAADYAALTRKVYALFEGREDGTGYNSRDQEWLEESIWPRLTE
ncbi:MAG: helix-turn-helix transcriptional regulator [Clostridia bacterium]|nr:helix-turn-helix transcriptional regulator [Clostridia bacterium]